ncbi:MAG: hypothetical protein RL264_161 [Bacteroidota bacterium]|jgi:hypothetical protein
MEDVNKYLDNYNQTPRTRFERIYDKATRFFWWCAGADEQILLQCPKSDRVKYAGIGGIVFCTGLLASVSGGYAFYTIFGPKKEAINFDPVSIGATIVSIIFGLIWGAIIFNMDRFIVSSTGKGDGKDSISLKEFGQALPRIAIAVILGFAISAPLEIRILKTEIDVKLHEQQKEVKKKLDELTYAQSRKKIDEIQAERTKLEKEINNLDAYFEKRRLEINAQRDKLEDEVAGRVGSGKAGEGPAYRSMKENLDSQQKELEEKKKNTARDIKDKKDRLEKLRKDIEDVNKDIEKEKKRNQKTAESLDGLLNRIQISHEIGGIVPWVILLVFLSIEAGPIFFKMMMTKGPYDYLVENNKKKIQLRHGIVVSEKLVDTINGSKDAEKVEFLELENEKHLKETQLAVMQKNSEKIIRKHGEKIAKEIDENPDNFYTES